MAAMAVMVEIPQPVAVTAPALMIVAKAVAGTPTCTERLVGKTAASSGLGLKSSAAVPFGKPPATSTRPVSNSVALLKQQAVVLAVADQVPVDAVLREPVELLDPRCDLGHGRAPYFLNVTFRLALEGFTGWPPAVAPFFGT